VAGSFGVHWLNRRVAPDHADCRRRGTYT
jgi:hypothetical protein